MSKDKTSLTVSSGVLKTANGKTLSNMLVYQHGSTHVVEMNWTDSTTSFLKFLQGQCETGGTNEWGTGTKL